MQQLIEQLLLYGRGVWRFRWIGVAIGWLICLLGWSVLYKWPNTYESQAVVYVDTASLLRPLLKGLTVDVNVSEKLGLMSQQLLSRPNLEQVMRMTDLDHNVNNQKEFDKALAKLQSNISLEQSHTEGSTRRDSPDLYTISARHKNPDIARRIVQALLDTLVKDTVGDQRARSETAQKFLNQQISEYETRLTEAEKRLQDFKRRHIDALPDQQASFYQRLQTARTNLENVELALREARFRRQALQRQLDGTPAGQRAVGPDGSVIQTPTEERLLALQRKLDELLLRYTDQHPDVIETRNSIAQLKEQQRLEEEKAKKGEGGSGTVPNAAYQQLQVTLGQVDGEIAALEVRHREYKSRVDKLQQQIETLTKVEAELKNLNRNYEIYREQYNSLVARRESARISQDVEQSGEDVKFKVIDPPRTPLAAVAPPRLLLTAAIFVGGIGGGIGITLLFSQMWPVVYGRRMLHEITGRPVFGGVSRFRPQNELVRDRFAKAALVISILLIVPAFGLAAYLQITGTGLIAAIGRLGG